MDTTGSLLDYLARRLRGLSAPHLLILAVLLAVAAFMVATLIVEALVATTGPMVVAPFRW